MPDLPTEKRRTLRFVFAVFLVVGLFPALINPSNSSKSTFISLVVVYIGYLIACGTLQALIASRLYKQHEVREYKVDIGAMLLITTLIALPFGAASVVEAVRQFFSNELSFVNASDDQMAIPLSANLVGPGFFFFLMMPVFFITENLVTRYSIYRQWRRRRSKSTNS